jgi:phosphomannomutase
MLAALHAIAALGAQSKPLSEIFKPFNRYHSSGEINSTVKNSDDSISAITKKYGSMKDVTLDHLDGLTVEADTWWFNLRASNTEPLLRLNVEASSHEEMESIRDGVLNTIRS